MNIDVNRMGYGWSGGKDSLVITSILEKTKYKFKGYCVLYPLNFLCFNDFCIKNKPTNVNIYYDNRYDFDFINNNKEFLFNSNESMYNHYWGQLSRRVENKFYKENNLDLVIFGRRNIDGNSVRLTDNLPIQITKNKKIFNIIYDWSHEELLAYLKYNNIDLPSIYFERNGFKYGTHLWVERSPLRTLKDNLDEIWNIDKKTIINAAAQGMEVAKEYLKEKATDEYTKY